MKRFLLLLAAVSCVGFVSCSETMNANGESEENGGNDNKEYTVKFKVDMRVPELKEEVLNAEDDELSLFFVNFYNSLITNGLAVPNDYALTFTKDGEVVGEYEGTWGETEIALPNGTYQVTGECIGDFNTASFSFDESITIDKNTSILSLSPSFNCWIFAFDRQAFSNAWWCNGETPSKLVYLNKTDDFFYVFNSSELSKLPFVLGYSEDCNNLHEQIEYTDDNTWHLGFTWQDDDKNYPAKVGYLNHRTHIGDIYYIDKDERVSAISLSYIVK